jgi:HK97 family phage major capsid protein
MLNDEMLDLVRVARCMLLGSSYGVDPFVVADRLYGRTKHRNIVELIVTKADVDSHGTTGTGSELFSPARVSAAFSEAVRTESVLGQLATVPVPVATPLTWITTRTRFTFVEERDPIPVAAPAFAPGITLKPKKISGIVVTSRELLEASDAEQVLAREMISGCLEGLDVALLDPAVIATDGSPASVTSVASPVFDASAVDTAAEIDVLLWNMVAGLVSAGSTLQHAAFVTSLANCAGLAMLRDTTGDGFAFPQMTAKGGLLGGLPVIGTAYGPTDGLTLVDGGEILVYDSKETSVQVSQNASIDMNTEPAGTSRVSLFQTDAIGLKITRYVNWALRHEFVSYATNFELAPGSQSTTA